MKVFIDFSSGGTVIMWNENGDRIMEAYPHKYLTTKEVLCSKPNQYNSKKFYEDYGITPSNARKIWNGFLKDRVFDENKEINKLVFRGPTLNVALHDIKKFEYEELAQQCRKDGIANVIPAVVYYGKSPQELKKELGKSAWKKICKASYTKNKLIYHQISNSKEIAFENSFSIFSEVPYTLCHVKPIFQVPNIAKHIVASKIPMKNFLRTRTKGTWNYEDNKTAQKIMQTYIDTYRMSQRLNAAFNPEWSPRRMQEEHDRMTIEIRDLQRKELSERHKTRFDSFQELPVLEYKGIKATPMLTYLDVVDEGSLMQHCVGGYAENCLKGNYVVYSLQREDYRTTLGILRYEVKYLTQSRPGYAFNQHYGRFNESVTDEDFKELASKIIKELNERNNKHEDVYCSA